MPSHMKRFSTHLDALSHINILPRTACKIANYLADETVVSETCTDVGLGTFVKSARNSSSNSVTTQNEA